MIYFGINFLKGVNVFKQQKQYYAEFDDVSKLLISSPVYVKGYQVGLINEIKMISPEPIRFLVGINLEHELPITEGSYLEYGIDMFGTSSKSGDLAHGHITARRCPHHFKRVGLMDDVAAVMLWPTLC